jgi:hypothetical protein
MVRDASRGWSSPCGTHGGRWLYWALTQGEETKAFKGSRDALGRWLGHHVFPRSRYGRGMAGYGGRGRQQAGGAVANGGRRCAGQRVRVDRVAPTYVV